MLLNGSGLWFTSSRARMEREASSCGRLSGTDRSPTVMLPSERPVSKEHGLQTPCKPPVFNGEKGGPGGQNLYYSISTRP